MGRTVDEHDKIIQGTIGQITPLHSANWNQISVLIGSILSNKCNSFNGDFSMMTLEKDFIYQLTYSDNERKCESSIKSLRKGQISKTKLTTLKSSDILSQFENSNRLLHEVICWDWYWFEFWSDGSVTATYMFSECVDDTPCALAAIGPNGKIGTFKVDCFSSVTGSDIFDNDPDRYADVLIPLKPKIPGNDSTIVQGSFYVW